MTFWLFIFLVAALALFGVRSARSRRLQWLSALNLLGKWELHGAPPGGRRSITFSGEADGGGYVAKDADAVERGKWQLRGHTLNLEATEGEQAGGGAKSYDLRLFEPGRIGLDGPGREREIYVKRDSNVVPLRRRT